MFLVARRDMGIKWTIWLTRKRKGEAVMRALFDTTDAHPGRLATSPGLTRSAISKLVDRLLVKALASVRSDPWDGRAQLVDLTATGRRLVTAMAR